MKIWVVTGELSYDDQIHILGTFSSLELAEAFRKTRKAYSYDHTDIEQLFLDEKHD